MAKKNQEELRQGLPAGVKRLRTLEGHQLTVRSVAFDPQGETLASGSSDKTVKLWEVRSGSLLRTIEEQQRDVSSVAFDPTGITLASGGSSDGAVNVWDKRSGKLVCHLAGHQDRVYCVAFNPQGETLASGSHDYTIRLWNPSKGQLLRTLRAHTGEVIALAFDPAGDILASGSWEPTVKLWGAKNGKTLGALLGHKEAVWSLAFHPNGQILASGSSDQTIKLWSVQRRRLLRTLEGHTNTVGNVRFSPDGSLLASSSDDGSIRLWRCDRWEQVAVLPRFGSSVYGWAGLDFHPTLPLLACAGSAPDMAMDNAPLIHLWELNFDLLLGKSAEQSVIPGAVHHTTGKIVLVGDHSVGKSALGYRLIHGQFEKQESTHGQKFWVFPALGKRRADGTECEAILWDFAGQPDYRLVHALFVDNADLALVLFDASDIRDPLHGVEFWLKQLKAEAQQSVAKGCPIILVAAQTDRGTCSLTPEELQTFCERHGIVGPITTSAFTGIGIEELVERMKSLILWEDKAATVTTTTFKRIKDYVLGLKEGDKTGGECIVTPEELRRRLKATDADWEFSDAEMLTAVGHLENYGYVKRLRTSKGESRILLQPERLNNLASSFVLEARRNPKGLGALEEKRLLAGGYDFPELRDLPAGERDVLLDSAALLFLEHNVCFRETDPLRVEPYLVFPELINLKKPIEDEMATEDSAAYTVSGPTENVFASLVVLLGYTHTFTRTAQWQNNARYEVGDGLVCGFKQDAERDGELDLVLCFAPKVGAPVRTLFQGLFESFMARRNLTVMRYEPVRCSNAECGHLLDRTIVRQRLREQKTFAFCNDCGEKLWLPKMAEPIQLTKEAQAEVDEQRQAAEQRTRFEQAVFRVRAYIAEQKITPPECFISYAWGVPEHERWVEKRLATDLQKAGIQIVFDRRDSQLGDSLTRFISRIPYCTSVVVVGTPLYFQKFENRVSSTGSVVAAEVDLINQRLIGTQEEKRTVKTLLLAGAKKSSLPPLMWDGIHADFRDESGYFLTAFDLILSLYELPPNHPAVVDLRESLRGFGMR
ncbi:MAG TPA: GTP-binding protein [Pyrinomonadaceae bacterium]|nr:GTP-binding protein [Pyrinomonadaceae bacterium]